MSKYNEPKQLCLLSVADRAARINAGVVHVMLTLKRHAVNCRTPGKAVYTVEDAADITTTHWNQYRFEWLVPDGINGVNSLEDWKALMGYGMWLSLVAAALNEYDLRTEVYHALDMESCDVASSGMLYLHELHRGKDGPRSTATGSSGYDESDSDSARTQDFEEPEVPENPLVRKPVSETDPVFAAMIASRIRPQRRYEDEEDDQPVVMPVQAYMQSRVMEADSTADPVHARFVAFAGSILKDKMAAAAAAAANATVAADDVTCSVSGAGETVGTAETRADVGAAIVQDSAVTSTTVSGDTTTELMASTDPAATVC